MPFMRISHTFVSSPPMAAHFNHAGIPLLFDPLLIPVSADLGIKEDELNSIIVRPFSPVLLPARMVIIS